MKSTETHARKQDTIFSASQRNNRGIFVVQRRRARGFWRSIPGLTYGNIGDALACVSRSKHRGKLRVVPAGVPQ